MRSSLLTILLPLALAAVPQPIVFQAEALPFTGDWRAMPETGSLDKQALIALDEKATRPAVGFVPISEAGRWQLWVRARDFPKDRPGLRRFAVEINGVRTQAEFGAHGVGKPDGPEWVWEDGGVFELPAGPALVALLPVTPWCRADALALVPVGMAVPSSAAALQAATVVPLASATPAAAQQEASPVRDTGRELARIEGTDTALVFTQGEQDGRTVIMLRVDLRQGGTWQTVLPARPESYDVLTADEGLEIAGRGAGILVNWQVAGKLCTVTHGATSYETRITAATGDPERCGRLLALRPSTCRKVGDTVELTGESEAGTVRASWELKPGDPFPALTLEFTPRVAGIYGLRYAATTPIDRDEVQEVTCPFLFAYRRLPEKPELIPTELTATPMATVQLAGPRTLGVAFDPADLPKEWPDCAQFEAGFQLVDGEGRAQPSAWLVVPGGQGSILAAGESTSGRVRLIARNTDWFETYRTVTQRLCQLRDYRQNHDLSLTDTLLNVIDLMADDDATGWSPAQMGFWNIESRNTVTHAAPLALVEAALLTGDEDLLTRRAAPALAFLLSRPTCHVGADPQNSGRYGRFELGKPTATYGAAVRLSAWEMAGGYTPAFRDVSFDGNGDPVRTPSLSPMDDALAAYRVTGEKRYLDLAHQDALDYARTYLDQQTKEKPRPHFFQISHIGNWRSLLAVAEATNNPALSRMAAEIARRMVAGLYTWPTVVPGDMTINVGNRTRTNGWCWFKGPDLFLLGWPPMAGDHPTHTPELDYLSVPEKQVPGWLPSVVGLGIEQPTTYRRGSGTCAHIIMANWAPHLLRLNQRAPEPLFVTAAHNSTLGRWGTYPGYYRTDFTDLTESPDYARKGPDVTGIYWHHIPCFLMMLADYLVTDVEVRSGGQIRFPAARQCGYVWFDNRLFGHRPGTVYGREGVWPWLPRKGVALDRPELNWLAGHDEEAVYLFLTNTAEAPVQTRVSLDLARLDGAVESVSYRCDGGAEVSTTARQGSCRVPVSGNGLTVVRFQGLRARRAWRRAANPPTDTQGYAAETKTDSVAGTVRANWIGFGPDRAFAHIYSDHQGDKARRAELVLEQNGTSQTLTRDFWPLEFLAPIDATQSVRLTLTVIDEGGQRYIAPPLELTPPAVP